MTAGEPTPSPDDLRRALYRADATPQDVQRYLAHRPPPEPPVEQPPTEPALKPVGRRLRRVVAAAGAAAVLAGLVVAVQLARTGPDPRPPAASTRAEPALLQQIGEGRVLAVQEGAVSDPTAATLTVRGTAVVGERFTGRGNAVVALHAPNGSLQGGRVAVDLRAAGPTEAGWRALLTETRNETTTYPLVLARGSTPTSGSLVFRYQRLPPTRLAVTAPVGARWTLTVAITGDPGPRLR